MEEEADEDLVADLVMVPEGNAYVQTVDIKSLINLEYPVTIKNALNVKHQ